MLRKRARLEEEEDFEGSWTEIKFDPSASSTVKLRFLSRYARKAELAKKCRARKKVYIEGLEETVQRLNNAITIKVIIYRHDSQGNFSKKISCSYFVYFEPYD
jgi:hypothetical protein